MTSQNPGSVEGRTTPSLGPSFRAPGLSLLHTSMLRQTGELNVPALSTVFPCLESLQTTSLPIFRGPIPAPPPSPLCPWTTNTAFPGPHHFSQSLTLAIFNCNHLHSELGSLKAKAVAQSPLVFPPTAACKPRSPDPCWAIQNPLLQI